MRKKLIILILVITSISWVAYSQQNLLIPHAAVITNKDTIDINEVVIITYTLNFNPDSFSKFLTHDFSLVSGPNTSSSIKKSNDKTEYETTIKYFIRPSKSGLFRFVSPYFYFNGYKITADTIGINVKSFNLTENEYKKLQFSNLMNYSVKPDSTIQIVIYKDMGYYGIWKNGKLHINEALNNEQINTINKQLPNIPKQ